MLASSSNSSEWNNDDKWSSQVRKSGEMSRTSTGKLVSHKLVIDIDMDSDTAAESDLSLKSCSFPNRVNDRLRKMLNRSPEDSMQYIDKRSMIWRMFMSSTVEASVFMVKNCSDNLHSIKNTRGNLTSKKSSRYLNSWYWNKRMRFLECLKLAWEVLHGNSYLWSMMKKSAVSRMQRFISSQILCYALERWIWTQHQMLFGSEQLGWFKDSSQYTTLDTIDGEPMELEWNISQNPLHWSLSVKSKSSWGKWAKPNKSKDESSSCRCSMTSFGDIKAMKRNVLLIPHLCLYSQKDFQQGVGHSSDLGQKQSGSPLTKKDQEENEIESLKRWWSTSEKADTQFSEQRVRPCADGDTIETVFRTIISVNQLLYLRCSIRVVWRIQ